ncbi:MAG: Gfo/Idh/MocA family oxidoreductase [Lachnospiraceae bacterium]|nr:Gfo/Idh/MocA family oxidoreductase [Lachnospiraceae bacterium]
MITVSVCGCGSRGLFAYATYAKLHPDRMKIVAGADIRPERLRMLREIYGVAEENCFASDDEMFRAPKLSDAMIISTQDRRHVYDALKALDLGYDLILEKPISPEITDILKLQEKVHETGRTVVVCHVLRYTPFYSALKKVLDEGGIGRIITIDATENVGYYHFAHSFVRGNWRRVDETSPMILAKCCHDMDYLRWFADSPCVSVSSHGDLSVFTEKAAPEGAGTRCTLNCPAKERARCPYDAEKIYITGSRGFRKNGDNWPQNVVVSEPTEEKLYDALLTGPYGRCVYHCDNDVYDHQTVLMRFENGIEATFTTSAFSENIYRTIKITGTEGELEGYLEKDLIIVKRFGEEERTIDLSAKKGEFKGHGGGDAGLAGGFIRVLSEGGAALTSVDASVDSHLMALAAQASSERGGAQVLISDLVRACRA